MNSLYENILGETFGSLPPSLRELHGHSASVSYRGRGTVERGTGWLSRLIGGLMRFPPATADTAVGVSFDIHDGRETWTRQFGSHRFRSTLSANPPGLREAIGWVTILFQLAADATGLQMRPVGWRALGIPLPRALWPRIIAREYEEHGRFHFHVEAAMPVAGLIVRYCGHLQKVP